MSDITREALADLAKGIGMEQSAFAYRYLHDAAFYAVCRKVVTERSHALTLTVENAVLKERIEKALAVLDDPEVDYMLAGEQAADILRGE